MNEREKHRGVCVCVRLLRHIMQEEQMRTVMRRVASYFSVLYSHTDVSWGWKTFTGEKLHSLINVSQSSLQLPNVMQKDGNKKCKKNSAKVNLICE